MKLLLNRRAAQLGSVILLSLLVAAIAGITLASYLILTETQSSSIYRSQAWNVSLSVAEAGVEDALQLVNRYAGSMDERDLPKWTNHVSANNWTTLSPGLYYVQRHIPYQTVAGTWLTNLYEVWVTNINNEPKIYSRAALPMMAQHAPAPQTLFATIGSFSDGGGLNDPRSTVMRRDLTVFTKPDPLWAAAMAARYQIDLMGRNIATDSFDSADPNFSINGLYPLGMPARTRANGNVATAAAIVNTLNVGNAQIKGKVSTGPGGVDTIVIGPNGSVGDRAWVEGNYKGIKGGWASTDFNMLFPEVTLPPGVTWLPVSPYEGTEPEAVVDGTTYKYVFSSEGYYQVSGLSGSLLVNAPTNHVVTLYITENVELAGNDLIRIANTGAKVRVYMAGSQFSLTGSATIQNQSGVADRFYLFGMPTCTGITFAGNGHFYGAIYAPDAEFHLGGGGNDMWDFVGGSVTRTVMMNGHFRFHYDENLRRVGPLKGYVPVHWKEF